MGGGAEVPQARMHKRNNNGSWSTSSVSMGGAVRLCHCGSKAAIRTSKTKRNPGRPFYSCPLPKIMDHSQNSSYFCWVDEIVEDSIENGDNLDAWRKSQLILKMDSLINEVRFVRKCMIGMGCFMCIMCLLVLIVLVH
ncbi:Zinc finger, GRF-type [Sesbania bispinosa]|nr:Zinc finger, GRF-type [Sesbania bispinosa]